MSVAEPRTEESPSCDHVDGDALLAYLARATANVERAVARVEYLVGLKEQEGHTPEVAAASRPLRPLRRALVDLEALKAVLKQYTRAHEAASRGAPGSKKMTDVDFGRRSWEWFTAVT